MTLIQKTIVVDIDDWKTIDSFCKENKIAFSRFLANSAIKAINNE